MDVYADGKQLLQDSVRGPISIRYSGGHGGWNDADADCWVVSLEYEAPGAEASAARHSAVGSMSDFFRTKTLWVDKSRYFVYREDSTTKMTLPNTHTPTTTQETSKVESLTVNDPVSPDVFTFTGAKEIETSKFMPKNGQASQTQN